MTTSTTLTRSTTATTRATPTRTTFCCNLAASCADANVYVTKLQVRSIICNYANSLGVFDVITDGHNEIDWDVVFAAYIEAAECNSHVVCNNVPDTIVTQLRLECIVLFPHCSVQNVTNDNVVVLHRGDRNFYDYITHSHTQIHAWYDEYLSNKNYIVTM